MKQLNGSNMYYMLRLSFGGRTYPQIQSHINVSLDQDYGGFSEIGNCIYELPDKDYDFPKLALTKGSKPTDFLSAVYFSIYRGFLLNNKALNVLEQFKLPTHKLFNVDVHHKGTDYIYHWLHFKTGRGELIDYHKSMFRLVNALGRFVSEENYCFNDIGDLESFMKTVPLPMMVRPYRIYVKEKEIKTDLFQLGGSTFEFHIVNESIKYALTKEKVTGIEFHPVPAWIMFE